MDKWALYYTDNYHPPEIEAICRAQLCSSLPADVQLVSVSREPIQFGYWNIVVPKPRGVTCMHEQILAGVERIGSGWVWMCENDVLYHASHFELKPDDTGVFWYNTNVWRLRYADGFAVWTDDLQQLSGCTADCRLLIAFYRERVAKIARGEFDRHFEPGPKCGRWQTLNWRSTWPNVDIRHNGTLTKSKWSPDEFRNKRYARGWQESDSVPGWGAGADIIARFDDWKQM